MKTKLLLLLFLATFSIYAQTNLVSNGDFETWSSSSQPKNWFVSFSGYTSQSSVAQNGASSANMMIASGTTNFINTDYFPVTAGKTYRVTLYHRLAKGTFTSIDLSLYHKPGTFKEQIVKKSDITFSTTEWRKVEFEYTPTVSENIEVDVWTYGSLNSEILVDNISMVDVNEKQYTTIPDINFENKLISLGIDSGAPDGKVLTSKVTSLTSLNVSNSAIFDLTGIEDFVSLKLLDCTDNSLTQLNLSKNIELTGLFCSNNKLTTLDLSTNKVLNQLNCSTNRLTQLNVSKSTALTNLNCSNNLLATIDLSPNSLLLTLGAEYNKLTEIDLSNNTALTSIRCAHNQFTSLDVSKQLALETLDCSYNWLSGINVSSNVKLLNLMCNNNSLQSLDLSKNDKLTFMFANNNLLTSLNIKNGTNYLFNPNTSVAAFYGNPYLTCIQVDDVAEAKDRWINRKDSHADFSTDCAAFTAIPDVNFEKRLIALGIDRDGLNGKVLTSNAASVTTLRVNGYSIADLTGIQDFTSLTILDCSDNQLTALDISKNINLIDLRCGQNKLTALNVSKNVNLKSLYCSYNKLPTLDISSNLALQSLTCQAAELTTIDLSKSISLTSLLIDDNKLTNFNGSGSPALKSLFIQNNQLTSLDVSNNTSLNFLACNQNFLTSLDLRKNTALTSLNCHTNNIKCILVDDVDYAYANLSSYKDAFSAFTKDCNAVTLIPDINFENKLISLGLDSGAPDGKVLTTNIAPLTNLDIKGSSIKDLTGIEAFRELKTISAEKNELTTLDFSSNKNLTVINVRENKLKNINVRENNLLIGLGVSKNELTTLDVSQNIELWGLTADNNQLTSLNVSKNLLLQNVIVNNNQLTSLDLSNNTLLNYVQCSSNKLTNLNLQNVTNITSLYCHDNLLTSLNVSDKASLIEFTCYKNYLTNLNVTNNTKLNSLDCTDNKLTSLDVTQNTKLLWLACEKNQLTTINVSKNTMLNQLYVSNNFLTAIDVLNNPELTIFYCYSNQITSVDISKNPKIKYLQVDLNNLTSLNLKNGNNTILDRKYTNFNNNPNLTCIQVDNAAYSDTNWPNLKDAAAKYNTTCSSLGLQDSVFSYAVLSPNPTKGEININNITLDKATVYNSLGQLVKSFTLNNSSTDNTINLSGLPKGVYYVYLINGNAASAKKVIVE